MTAGLVFALFLAVPLLSSPIGDPTAASITLAYLVLDFVVLASLIWLLVGGGRPRPALLLVSLSLTFTLIANVARDIALAQQESLPSHQLLDALLIAALITMAAAATTPSAEAITTPPTQDTVHASTSRLIVLALGVLAVPSLVALRLWGMADQTTVLLSLGAVFIIILAVWRITLLVAALERQQHVTELVLDSAGDGIVGLDREGNVLFANLAARRMLGCREDDLIGRRFHDVAHHEYPDGRPFPWLECPVRELVMSGSEAYLPDHVYVRRDGTSFPVEIVLSPLFSEGTAVGAVQSFRDVSERTAVDELKRQLVSVVSHELRTPLTSIHGSLRMLDSGIVGSLNDDQRELLTMAVVNSDRLGRLVNDILDIERLDAGRMPLKPELTDALVLAEQAVVGIGGAAGAAGVRLSVEDLSEGASTAVWADPHRILQVLTNLLGNAIKFSESPVHGSRHSRGLGRYRSHCCHRHWAGNPRGSVGLGLRSLQAGGCRRRPARGRDGSRFGDRQGVGRAQWRYPHGLQCARRREHVHDNSPRCGPGRYRGRDRQDRRRSHTRRRRTGGPMTRSVLVVDDEPDVRTLAVMSLGASADTGFERRRRAPSASLNSPLNCRTSSSWT